jgi:hypothetical protein
MKLKIGDGTNWQYINGDWKDGEGGSLRPTADEREFGEENFQGFHYAFYKGRCFSDFDIEFEIRGQIGDAGLIFGAKDVSDFHMIHFPSCNQIWRAHAFHAVISHMDENGYLKIDKDEMIKRVDSIKSSHKIKVGLHDRRLSVKVDDRGSFDMYIKADTKGYIGVAQYYSCHMADIEVTSGTCGDLVWNKDIVQHRNWFNPVDDARTRERFGKMQIINGSRIIKMNDGSLMMYYWAMGDTVGGNALISSRSTDDGKTWQTPHVEWESRAGMDGGQTVVYHHRFPDGRLKMITLNSRDKNCRHKIADTEDEGITWEEGIKIDLDGLPDDMNIVYADTQGFLDLSDGSVLMFVYGECSRLTDNNSEFSWGDWRTQGYSFRSCDGGYTWGRAENLDGTLTPGTDTKTHGCMDFTEISAVQTGDGSIMALIRPNYSPWMWEAWSHDMGRSWEPVVFGPFAGSAPSNLLRTSSGAILMAHRFPDLTVNVSMDEGRTWDEGTIIDTGLWAMGCMVEVRPDIVLFVYCDSFEDMMRAQYIKVTDDGLQTVDSSVL